MYTGTENQAINPFSIGANQQQRTVTNPGNQPKHSGSNGVNVLYHINWCILLLLTFEGLICPVEHWLIESIVPKVYAAETSESAN
jgi:hypothetical protein